MEKIIFLHGFTETIDMWDTIRNLDMQDRMPVYVDVNSLFEAKDDLREIAQQILAQNDDAEKLFVLGHSMGGYIGLQMIQLADKVAGLCLLHSNPFADSEDKKQSRAKQIRFVEEHGREKYMETTIPNLFLKGTNPDVLQNQIALTESISDTEVKHQLTAMMNRPDTSEEFRNYSGYKQVCLGMKDPLMNYEDTLNYIKDFDEISLNLSEQAGHMSYIEDPDFFVRSVEEFLFETKTLD